MAVQQQHLAHRDSAAHPKNEKLISTAHFAKSEPSEKEINCAANGWQNADKYCTEKKNKANERGTKSREKTEKEAEKRGKYEASYKEQEQKKTTQEAATTKKEADTKSELSRKRRRRRKKIRR